MQQISHGLALEKERGLGIWGWPSQGQIWIGKDSSMLLSILREPGRSDIEEVSRRILARCAASFVRYGWRERRWRKRRNENNPCNCLPFGNAMNIQGCLESFLREIYDLFCSKAASRAWHDALCILGTFHASCISSLGNYTSPFHFQALVHQLISTISR